ncbi:MAG: two-component regulator propeller domain-containing protein [Cyclobacteriaceae bacterium]
MNNIKTVFRFVLCVVGCQLSVIVYAQEIPIHTWRDHVSFNSIHTVSIGAGKVYAGAENGIVVLEVADNSSTAVTKLTGLSSTGITQVCSDQPRQQVLVSYEDGNLDILKSNEIINYNGLKTSPTITGSRKINHIAMRGNLAYLSADYGMVVFDLIQLQVKETWRDLGPAGETIEIYQSTFRDDSIFVATEQGVLAGDLDDNLLDFNNWKRFDSGVFSGAIQSVTTFDDDVFAAINGSGIHRYENGAWSLQTYLQGLSFKNITSGQSNLFITEGNNLYAVNVAGVLSPIADPAIVNPVIAFEDTSGKRWIGDGRNGLVSDKTGLFERYVPNGPSFSEGLKLSFDATSNKMYAVSGGYTSSFSPLLNHEYLNYFSSGSWQAEPAVQDQDLTDVKVSGNRTVLSSFGKGVQVIENGSVTFQDETTSPNVTALAVSAEGIWVTNYGASQSLNLLKHNNAWESFSFPSIAAARYPTKLITDFSGNVWMVLSPSSGGGILVFDKEANETAYLTEATGAGGLPSRLVYSIALDRDGSVWVGTSAGVAYFPSPGSVFTGSVNAVKPIFENRPLLKEEKVTVIDVDGGNRKWIGTENGVWLFNPFGEEQVYYFNAANSPLLTDEMVDIEINSLTGEVFFMTDKGITSFRSNATSGNAAFQNVKIFPNPVTPQFNGFVGISGLATDAFVKITDVSGKLIWQTQANGGTASWNVRDYNGRRAATGMYLVFATATDGSESVVGKIAVVE